MRKRPLTVRIAKSAAAIGAMLTLASCASLQPGDAADASSEDPTVQASVSTESTDIDGSSAPVDETTVSARLAQGIPTEALPDGFHLVDQLSPEGDAQPAQVFGTAAYEAAAADPKVDQGPTVAVRTVPMSPDQRASAPTTTSPEVTAEPRDDIAPGAVMYNLKGANVPSITVPAGDVDFIIAGTNVDIDTLVAFAKAVIR